MRGKAYICAQKWPVGLASQWQLRQEDGALLSRNNSVVRSRIIGGGHVFREGVGILVHRSKHNLIEGNGTANVSA